MIINDKTVIDIVYHSCQKYEFWENFESHADPPIHCSVAKLGKFNLFE